MAANVLIELDNLHLHRPGLTASAAQVAAWYLAKATTLDHLGRAADAAAARAHAARLGGGR